MTERKIEASVSGFTPLFDVVARDPVLIDALVNDPRAKRRDPSERKRPLPTSCVAAALVFGAVWRHCQMKNGVCYASREKMAKETGLSLTTFNRWLPILCEAGYLRDLTPELTHKPHTYADTGKVRIVARIGVETAEEVCRSGNQNAEVCRSGSQGMPQRYTRIPSGDHQRHEDKDDDDLLIEDLINLIHLEQEQTIGVVKALGVERTRWRMALAILYARNRLKYFSRLRLTPDEDLEILSSEKIERIITDARLGRRPAKRGGGGNGNESGQCANRACGAILATSLLCELCGQCRDCCKRSGCSAGKEDADVSQLEPAGQEVARV